MNQDDTNPVSVSQLLAPYSDAIPLSGDDAAVSRRISAALNRGLASLALLLLCLFAFCFRLGTPPLFDLDEGLYVTCARQMAVSGDWTTPRLNSRPPQNPAALAVPFYEKPILVYWAAASAWKTFGQSEGAARLPSALAALVTVFLIVRAGTKRFGRRAGGIAGMVYATAPLVIADARQMTTDGLLVLWTTLSLLAFDALRSNSVPLQDTRAVRLRANFLNFFVFWVSCALAVLTKGAVGLLLPVLVVGITLFLDEISAGSETGLRKIAVGRLRRWREAIPALKRMHPVLGMVLLLLMIAPWHLRIAKTQERDAQGRTWAQEYIGRQHIGRFRGGDKVHNAPLPAFFAYFLLGFFPWACFAPAAFRIHLNHKDTEARRIHGEEKREDGNGHELKRENNGKSASIGELRGSSAFSSRRFLLIWFWTIFVFFSLGAAKLPTYIAPIYPPAALLVGRWLDETIRRGSRSLERGTLGAVVTVLLLGAAVWIAPRFIPTNAPVAPAVFALATHITLILLLGGLLARGCFVFGRTAANGRMAGVGVLAVTMLAVVAVGCTEGYAVVEHDISGPYQRLADRAYLFSAGYAPVIYYDIVPRRPSMLYYARYSPYEFGKEQQLLPALRPLLSPTNPNAIVVMSRQTWNTRVTPELDSAPDLTAQILAEEGDEKGGWVLIRIRPRRSER